MALLFLLNKNLTDTPATPVKVPKLTLGLVKKAYSWFKITETSMTNLFFAVISTEKKMEVKVEVEVEVEVQVEIGVEVEVDVVDEEEEKEKKRKRQKKDKKSHQ